MIFRIYIPALQPDGVSMTIDVEAQNWMMGLRAGLDEIGANPDIVKRAICDIKADKTIHVMEPAQGRVFVLRELPAHEQPGTAGSDSSAGDGNLPVGEAVDAPPASLARISERPRTRSSFGSDSSAPLRSITSELPAWASDGREEVPWDVGPERAVTVQNTTAADPAFHRASTQPVFEATDTNPFDEAGMERVQTVSRPKRQISHLDLDGMVRDDPRIMARIPTEELPSYIRTKLREAERESEELFAEVFEEMAEINLVAGDELEEGLSFALELAVRRIPSEAGWLLLADMNRRDLYFATAMGPRAEEVIEYRLPMGKGIAGFCAVNGVSLALSDVERDPRFQLSVSKSIGYRIESVACAPVQYEGRVFGAIQIMNHQRRAEYTPGELDILNYIARRTAEFLALHVS